MAALKMVRKQELLDFVAENIRKDSPKRRKLSIQVYGSQHLMEYQCAKGETISKKVNTGVQIEEVELTTKGLVVHVGLNHKAAAEVNEEEAMTDDVSLVEQKETPRKIAERIDNIHTFKRAQQLYGSLRGGRHEAYAY